MNANTNEQTETSTPETHGFCNVCNKEVDTLLFVETVCWFGAKGNLDADLYALMANPGYTSGEFMCRDCRR
jgi:hypothetical protein